MVRVDHGRRDALDCVRRRRRVQPAVHPHVPILVAVCASACAPSLTSTVIVIAVGALAAVLAYLWQTIAFAIVVVKGRAATLVGQSVPLS